MSATPRRRLDCRFTTTDLLLAVAVDAVLADAVVEFNRGGGPVLWTLVIVTYLVIPLLILPLYRLRPILPPRRYPWHTRRNTTLLLLIAGSDFFLCLMSGFILIRPDEFISRIICWTPIGLTMFLIYSEATRFLRRRAAAVSQGAVLERFKSGESAPPVGAAGDQISCLRTPKGSQGEDDRHAPPAGPLV